MRKPKSTHFSDKLTLKVPHEISETLKQAAAQRLMTQSQYVRSALIAALEKDGVCVMPNFKPAA
jgi:hypothetical protein